MALYKGCRPHALQQQEQQYCYLLYIKCKVLRICATRWRYYSVCFDVVVVRVGRVKWAPIRWVHRRLGSSTGEELWRRPGWAAKRPPENCRTRGKTDTTCLDPNRVLLPFISMNKMQTKLGLFNHIYILITFFIFIAEEQCCKKVVWNKSRFRYKYLYSLNWLLKIYRRTLRWMGQSGVVVVVFHDECPGSKAPQFCKSWAESDKSWIIITSELLLNMVLTF